LPDQSASIADAGMKMKNASRPYRFARNLFFYSDNRRRAPGRKPQKTCTVKVKSEALCLYFI
jgi:hypothetical protein